MARIYALLLRIYPRAFRERFGEELLFAFTSDWNETKRSGITAAIRLLTLSAADVIANGLRERRSNRWYSPRAERDAFMPAFLSDLKFGLRLMLRTPQLTAIAVCTLALGIGLSVSLYSVAHQALVSPLPFRDESRVVMMYEHAPQTGTIRGNVAPANFLDWRERSTAFSHMGALRPLSATVIAAGGEAVRADGRLVLGDAFQALGLDPLHGRLFAADDEQPGRDVVILSHRFWQARFAADPAIVGRSIMVDERPRTVIAVLKPVLRVPGGPPGFDEVFVPWILTPQQRQGRMSHISEAVARVKPGVTLVQAQADIARVAEGIASEHPQSNKGESVLLVPLREVLVGDVRPALIVLVAAVSLVLLIACVNVASLLLARATTRRQEMHVRVALGAGRTRLLRQLLAESLLLACAAGAVGLVLAFWCVAILRTILPGDLATTFDPRLDWPVAAGALAISIVTAVVSSLAPAWFVAKGAAASAVREGRGANQPSATPRRILVTVQVAMAVVLLAGAGLLMRSFVKLTSVDSGIRPEHLLTFAVELPRSRYEGPRQWQPFFERLATELRSIPGVTGAAGTSGLPLNENGGSVGFLAEGQPPPADNDDTYVIYRLVTPGYFDTIGMPLLGGRDFSSNDRIDGVRVVIVNERLARRYWPGQNAVGKRVAFTRQPKPGDWSTIVGVVGDTHHSSLAEPIDIQLYVPYMQEPDWYPPGQIVVRTIGEPTAIVSAVRQRVRSIDPLIPISDFQTMEALIGKSVAAPRFTLVLIGALGLSALVLSVIGIYGLLAFSVAMRTREIGVRSALGAGTRTITAMVLSEGLRLASVGIVAGVVIALAAVRWLKTMLFEVQPYDPPTFGAVAILLLAVAAIACYAPARRAARIDPLTALRTD